MSELEERLAQCFEAVLPEVERDRLRHLTMKSAAEWDSVVTVTLVSLIEESFGFEVQPEDVKQFTSFESIRQYLQRKIVTDAHH
jgi:acyl carrier protein